MKKRCFGAALCLLAAFALWTALVCLADVRPIGPQGSCVGLSAINGWFHRLTGVHMALYTITDDLSIIPICCVMGFGMLGLSQWIRRGSLARVDRSILLLGGFYVAMFAAYALFEVLVINYRPVLIDGRLEASYPSSTTMLVLCVMSTTAMQLRMRIKMSALRRYVIAAIAVFTAFMVASRLLSGVHWLTDVVGSALLSAGLVMLYASLIKNR